MNKNSEQKSIRQYAMRESRASAFRFSCVIFAMSGMIFFAHALAEMRNGLEITTKAFRKMLWQDIRLGDIFSLKNGLESIVSAGIFSHSWVVLTNSSDSKGPIQTIGNVLPVSVDRFLNRGTYTTVTFYGGKAYLITTDRIGKEKVADGIMIADLYLAYPIGCQGFLIAGMLSLISFIFTLFISRRSYLQMISRLSDPIRFLAANLDENNISKVNQEKLVFDEIKNLYFKFQNLVSRIMKIEQDASEMREQCAIANTTVMLAHDVRKPFTTVQAAMSMFNHMKSIQDLKSMLPLINKEVDESLMKVNSMLSDIMEFGKGKTECVESHSPTDLLRVSLEEVAQASKKNAVYIMYDLNHERSILVDRSKVHRVLSNLLCNSIQAIHGEGSISIATRDFSSWVEFKVSNAGFLSEEECIKAFEAFYTRGKKDGTGLGLAIAKKIVLNHGGKILIKSCHQRRIVDVIFTLPASDLKDDVSRVLPHYLVDFVRLKYGRCNRHFQENSQVVENFVLWNQKHRQGKKLTIGILDDEALYRRALIDLVQSSQLRDFVEFDEYSDPYDVINKEHVQWDAFISDIDLNHYSLNGYDVLQHLKTRGFRGGLCMHSNKLPAYRHNQAKTLDATAFLLKPMALEHLFLFIKDSFEMGKGATKDRKPFITQGQPTIHSKVPDCSLN